MGKKSKEGENELPEVPERIRNLNLKPKEARMLGYYSTRFQFFVGEEIMGRIMSKKRLERAFIKGKLAAEIEQEKITPLQED